MTDDKRETQIQPYQSHGGAMVRFDPEVEGDLHEYDMRPPVVVLGQAGSLEATAGMFHRLDTDEEYETMAVVPVFVRATRTRMPAEFARDSRPLCWSEDGLTPARGGDLHGQVAACLDCAWYTAAPWQALKGQCKGDYAAVFLDVATSQPFLLRLRGTAAAVARVVGRKGVYRAAVVTLYAEAMATEKGKWWQLKVKVQRTLTETEVLTMKALLDSGLRETSVAIQEAEGGEMAEAESPPFPVAGTVAARGAPQPSDGAPVAVRAEAPRNVITSGRVPGQAAPAVAQPGRRSTV